MMDITIFCQLDDIPESIFSDLSQQEQRALLKKMCPNPSEQDLAKINTLYEESYRAK
jgi:hypothetical protein